MKTIFTIFAATFCMGVFAQLPKNINDIKADTNSLQFKRQRVLNVMEELKKQVRKEECKKKPIKKETASSGSNIQAKLNK